MGEPQKRIPDPTLSALLDEAEAIQARIREYLVACAAPPVQPLDDWNHWPADAGHADHVKPSKMARREGCSVTTITRRCEREGVGKKYDGKHWRVSLWRNEAWKKSSSK